MICISILLPLVAKGMIYTPLPVLFSFILLSRLLLVPPGLTQGKKEASRKGKQQQISFSGTGEVVFLSLVTDVQLTHSFCGFFGDLSPHHPWWSLTSSGNLRLALWFSNCLHLHKGILLLVASYLLDKCLPFVYAHLMDHSFKEERFNFSISDC